MESSFHTQIFSFIVCGGWTGVKRAADSPSPVQPRSRSSSIRLFCQRFFSCFISFFLSWQDAKRRGLCAHAIRMVQKSRHFNPKRGQARTDACGYTILCQLLPFHVGYSMRRSGKSQGPGLLRICESCFPVTRPSPGKQCPAPGCGCRTPPRSGSARDPR